MPIVGAGLGYQAELTARRVPIFGAELVGRKVELRNCIGDDRRVVSGHAQIVVIDTVHRKIIVTRTRSANRSADSLGAARLCNNIGGQHREIQWTAVQCSRGIGEVHIARIIGVVYRRGCSLNFGCAPRDFHDFRSDAQVQMRVCYVVLIGKDIDFRLHEILKALRFYFYFV